MGQGDGAGVGMVRVVHALWTAEGADGDAGKDVQKAGVRVGVRGGVRGWENGKVGVGRCAG